MATATASPIDVEKTRTRLNVLWTATIPLNHASAEPARRYLAQRGLADLLQDPPPVWRFHPALEYWQTTDGQTKLVGCFPALVAKIQSPTGTPVGLHQTYLTPLGDKANVPEVRKSRSLYKGALRGAAIRLYPATERLVVGEGIETVLSVRTALPDWPCWSCLSATGLANVQIPPSVGEVLIAADADPAGGSAAEKLADRLTAAGKTVRVLQPDVGQDWNDPFIRSIRHE
jgi:putative DNA primase/helicase